MLKSVFGPTFAPLPPGRSDFIKILYFEFGKPPGKIPYLGLIIHRLDTPHRDIITANPHEDYKRGLQLIAAAKALQPVGLSEKLVILFTC